MTTTKPELQQRIQDALGLPDDAFHYHASDLYVLDLPGVMPWLTDNYKYASNVERFTGAEGSAWAGKRCLNIPFAGNWPPTH